MPFPLGALTCWIAAGHIAFDQRATQGFGDRRKLSGQALPALAKRQLGKSGQLATCFHLNASIDQNRGQKANANLTGCEFPPTPVIQKAGVLLMRSSWHQVELPSVGLTFQWARIERLY